MRTYEQGTICLRDPTSLLYISLGVASFTDSIKFDVKSTRIPTMSSSATFTYDKGSSETINISFTRRNPDVQEIADDSRTWSNAKWAQTLSALIDRWQMRTDGCKFYFLPKEENIDEWEEYEGINGYLNTMKIKWTAGVPDVLTGDMTFLVGSTYANAKQFSNDSVEPTVKVDDMYIQMTDSTNMNVYTLLSLRSDESKVSELVSCIESYSIEGGMNQPFEILSLSIPKKRLSSVAPLLVNDIVAGKNMIKVNAYGIGEYIVTKCSLSNNNYNITAYAIAELFKSSVISGEMTSQHTPLYLMTSILETGITVAGRRTRYTKETGTLIINVNDDSGSATPYYNHWFGEVRFPPNTNKWTVLQVCAMKLGAKIWFSEDKCYVVDTRINGVMENYGDIDIFNENAESLEIYKDVVGSAESGDEGTTTVANTSVVTYGNDNTEVMVPSIKDRADDNRLPSKDYYDLCKKSRDYYGERETSLSLPYIKSEEDARYIAYNYLSYLIDSQTSIGYTLKETVNGDSGVSGWHRTYSLTSRADSVLDRTNDIKADNRSVCHEVGDVFTEKILYNLLTISSYKRQYPDGTSKYWWGVQRAMDMSSTISEIKSALQKG